MNYTVIMRHESGMNEVLEVTSVATNTPGTGRGGANCTIMVKPSRFLPNAKPQAATEGTANENAAPLAHHPV